MVLLSIERLTEILNIILSPGDIQNCYNKSDVGLLVRVLVVRVWLVVTK